MTRATTQQGIEIEGIPGLRASRRPVTQETMVAGAPKRHHGASLAETLLLIELAPKVREMAMAGSLMTTKRGLQGYGWHERLDTGALRQIGPNETDEKIYSLVAADRGVYVAGGGDSVRVDIAHDRRTIGVAAAATKLNEAPLVGTALWLPDSCTLETLQGMLKERRATELLRGKVIPALKAASAAMQEYSRLVRPEGS